MLRMAQRERELVDVLKRRNTYLGVVTRGNRYKTTTMIVEDKIEGELGIRRNIRAALVHKCCQPSIEWRQLQRNRRSQLLYLKLLKESIFCSVEAIDFDWDWLAERGKW